MFSIDLVYNLCISVRLYVSSFLLSGPSLGQTLRNASGVGVAKCDNPILFVLRNGQRA